MGNVLCGRFQKYIRYRYYYMNMVYCIFIYIFMTSVSKLLSILFSLYFISFFMLACSNMDVSNYWSGIWNFDA